MSYEDRAARSSAWKTICEFFGLTDSDVASGTPSATTVLSGSGSGAWVAPFITDPAGAAQTATHIYGSSGVPSNANGANGDFYFRSDGAAGTFIYHKAAGVWTAFA